MYNFTMNKGLWNDLSIGNRVLCGNVALAPMAGTSDLTFRTICHEQGASLGCTELVTARGIRYDSSLLKSYRYLEIDPEREGPAAIQLFGYDPKDFDAAIPLILEHPVLSAAFSIDLNMGCPVNKVVKTGAGSALMKDLPLAASILDASVRAASPYHVPVTVKFRKGWDETTVNCVSFAAMCRDHGAAAVTVHARTRNQMYSGTADWEAIAAVVSELKGSGVPVFGNGDVKSGGDAIRMLATTGADGVMIGRAAQGNPWIFASVKALLMGGGMGAETGPRTGQGADVGAGVPGEPHIGQGVPGEPTVNERADIIGQGAPGEPTVIERADMIRRHLNGLIGRLGEEVAVREMRAQLASYLHGQKHASRYKVEAMEAKTFREIDELLKAWVEEAGMQPGIINQTIQAVVFAKEEAPEGAECSLESSSSRFRL